MSRRLSAGVLTLVLLVGHVAVCAGWLATAEARMACCTEGSSCPMHKPGSGESATITQARADSCCASSERDEAGPSASLVAATISSAVLGTAIVLPVSPPALVLSEAWRTVVPIPVSPVPKHLLLSVFLV